MIDLTLTDLELVKHQFLNSDCFTQLASIPDKSIRIIFADPPYNMTNNKWEYELTSDRLQELWSHYLRILIDDGTIFFFTKQPFTSQIYNSQPDLFRYEIIWQKEKPTLFFEKDQRPLPIHENILVFSKQYPNYYKVIYEDDKKRNAYSKIRTKNNRSFNYSADSREQIITESSGERYPTTILDFSRDHANKGIHSTQKPVDLYKWLILRYSKPNEMIFDPFCGSASSVIAAIELKRQFLAYENDVEIYDLAFKRLRYFLIHAQDNFKKPAKISPKQTRLQI